MILLHLHLYHPSKFFFYYTGTIFPLKIIFRIDKKPLQIKKIIEDNINDVFKRKGQVLQSIVIDQVRFSFSDFRIEIFLI